jgi:N6-L-threonylcarbamoyladenine synthase
VTLHDVEAVAVTYGPGLIGALMVGLSAAKAIAMVYDIPLLAVNHIEAHMYANLMADASITVPCIGLIVSGGHTLLSHVRDWGDYEVLGQTCDDAAGEAFDKVAKMMGLAYPGGPIIDQMAKDGNAQAIPFPRARIKDNPYGFSFSGLKTSVLYYIRENPDYVPEDVAASFQEAVVDVLCKKSFQAAKAKAVAHVIVGGGVSLNSRLREHMQAEGKVQGIDVFFPDFMFSADNAGMIAGLAYQQFQKGVIHPLDVDAVPNLPLLNWG